MKTVGRIFRAMLSVLIDPIAGVRSAAREPPTAVWTVLLVTVVLIGVATIPRQLALLSSVFPSIQDPMLSAQQQRLQAGLIRLISADRIVATPTLLLASVLVVIAAEPMLGRSENARGALWAVIGIGVSPIVVARLGELAITYVLPDSALSTPGSVITLPHRFTTGPLLFWRHAEPPSAALEAIDPRINLIALWCVVLWALGLRGLSARQRFETWHFALPVACVGITAVVTWAAAPLVVTAILRLG